MVTGTHARFYYVSMSFARPLETAAHYRTVLRRVLHGLDPALFTIVAYALVPAGWHAVIERTGETSSAGFASRVVTSLGWRQGGQNALPHNHARVTCLDDATLLKTCFNVERLAVSLGLLARAEDWPWSSASDRFRLLGNLPVAARPFLSSLTWMDYLNQPRRGDRPTLARLAHNLTNHPRRLTAAPQIGQHAVGLALGRHHHQPHTHVERSEHLSV